MAFQVQGGIDASTLKTTKIASSENDKITSRLIRNFFIFTLFIQGFIFINLAVSIMALTQKKDSLDSIFSLLPIFIVSLISVVSSLVIIILYLREEISPTKNRALFELLESFISIQSNHEQKSNNMKILCYSSFIDTTTGFSRRLHDNLLKYFEPSAIEGWHRSTDGSMWLFVDFTNSKHNLTSDFLTRIHREHNGVTEILVGPEIQTNDIAFLRDVLLHTPICCEIRQMYNLYD